ncbi:hypothetical protein [Micromonospora sp. WMMD812]|uniref:hypothetical protein n=1 Tax=Micromonospora sp. WMMD812 TaxID=3015152 RepID=UPI00248B02D8|nr:hypothetical protein [Micromonospora sp. WMMD812]WBB69542.1 hypothetical protein O7603_09380 [Micromonospora sp. WMMD812]
MRRIDAALTGLPNDPRVTGSVSGLHLVPQSTMTHVAVQTGTPGNDSVRGLEPVDGSRGR